MFGVPAPLAVDAPSAVATCDPIRYDANRYWSPTDRLWGHSWSGELYGGREDCARRAMDLAVLNAGDTDELINQSAGAMAPFWLGVSWSDGWKAIDDCAPELSWASGQPATEALGQCVVMTIDGMATRPCAHTPMETTEHIQSLCETPRPDARCRALEAERTYVLAQVSVPHDLARAACERMNLRLVEINTTEELAAVQGVATTAFWLGASYSGAQWTAPSQCPQVFPWATEPTIVEGTPTCATADAAGAYTVSCDTLAAAVCEGVPGES